MDNYRSSLIYHFEERSLLVVAEQLQSDLEFTVFNLAKMALVALVDDLCLQMDKGCASLLVVLGLFAAFDMVDYSLLLKHLKNRY